jgi:hypothetical protein
MTETTEESVGMAKLNHKHTNPLIALLLLSCLALAALLYVGTSQAAASASSLPGSVRAVAGFAITSLSDRAAWVGQGTLKGAKYGYAVASAGDVNGDGFADVLVGAPLQSQLDYKDGAVYLYYGSASGLPVTADWFTGGGVQGSWFGHALASAGDVNGDGYDDVLVGAYRYKNGDLDTEEGAAFLFYGSGDGLSETPGWQVESDQPYAQLGYAVAGAGDLNGDGYDDLAVGARYFADNEDNQGGVYVYYGTKEGPKLTPDRLLSGDQAGAAFGTSLGSAGDVNGDGYDDLVVGAPEFDYEEANAGAVYVYHGSKDGLTETWNWRATSDQPEADFGLAVGTAGDVNGDGYDDLIVGAPGYAYEPASLGSVFVYHGSKGGLPETESWRADSGQSTAWFGMATGTAGDVNQDGYDDVIVGAYKYRSDQPEEGGAFVYLGAPAGLQPYYGWWAVGDKADAWFGYAVATAGDVDGNGSADVLVGAPNYRIDKDLVGRAYLYLGEASEGPLPTQESPKNECSLFLPLSMHALP